MADDEQDPKEYRWETGYEKTWEAIKEDKDGLVAGLVAEFATAAARRRAPRRGPARLGMMRHLLLAIDCSDAMASQDLKPTRFLCTLKLLEKFVEEFFDQNPLSQLGIIAMKNKRAERVTDLSGNVRKHVKAIQGLRNAALSGEPSLQNALELGARALRPLPGHASREILFLLASLTTCDPTDINTTIQTLKADGIRCSVIGLAAEVRICKKLCSDTGGDYGVVLDDVHYRSLLMSATTPPARARSLEAGLIKMGFPHAELEGPDAATDSADPPITVCMCHMEEGEGIGGEGHLCPQCHSKYCELPVQCRTCSLTLAPAPHLITCHMEEGEGVGGEGHLCPQCRSKYCELPVQCRTCSLTLASAPHLARSYHHLFPVEAYEECLNEGQAQHCFGCLRPFVDTDKQIYRCGGCTEHYCWECEGAVADTLHVCPGCASRPHLYQRLPTGPPAVD